VPDLTPDPANYAAVHQALAEGRAVVMIADDRHDAEDLARAYDVPPRRWLMFDREDKRRGLSRPVVLELAENRLRLNERTVRLILGRDPIWLTHH
jgi:hypothetical protein